jgi:hypothetical protein
VNEKLCHSRRHGTVKNEMAQFVWRCLPFIVCLTTFESMRNVFSIVMDNPKINLGNPLLTAEAKDIYRHLTNDENNRMWEFGRKWGLIVGIVPFVSIVFLSSHHFTIAIPLLVITGWLGFAPIRKEGKRILCETEYAKQKGFTPENFRLFIFERKKIAAS